MTELETLYNVEDPLELFWQTTRAIYEHQEAIDQLAVIRSRAVAALYAEGRSYKDLANELGLSAPRIGQIVSSNDAASINVMRAWHQLERRLEDVAGIAVQAKLLRPARRGPNYMDSLRALRDSNLFDTEALEYLEEIRLLRNSLVHGQSEVTPEQAAQVIDKVEFINANILLWLRRVQKTVEFEKQQRKHASETS